MIIDQFLDSFFEQFLHPEFWSGMVVGVCGILIVLIRKGALNIGGLTKNYGWEE